jgi:2-dehydro-3-deoxyglucarate aldolase
LEKIMDTLKHKLNIGCLTIGSWITLAHPAVAEIMAKAGFDWIAVDLEHSVITIREAEELIRVISLCGVAPLVRLTSVDHDQIKRVMDAGAHGIIVPMVKSRDEARQAIEAMYYPMRGRRSVGLARAQGYGVKFDEYRQWLDDHGVVIVQIEHIEAVHNMESILSLDGIDGYIIGPYDLSASMGLPGQLDHPAVVAAIEKVRNVGSAMNKPGGVHIVEPDLEKLRCYIKEGFTFIAYSVDFRMIDTVCRTGLLAIGRGE